jgi:hypothetical protein
MPKSDASWSGKLRRITELERPDHHLLRAEDDCYFLGEYTARKGYAHSSTNHLITNLKKKMHLRGTPQWQYKGQAIREAGAALASGLRPGAAITLVPIPPSKLVGTAEYDDRMYQVARLMGHAPDVRQMIQLGEARDTAHENENPRDWEMLKEKLRIDAAALAPVPQTIALIDDVLTTGCSFRACRSLIEDHLGQVTIIGLFVARRALESDFDPVDFDDL